MKNIELLVYFGITTLTQLALIIIITFLGRKFTELIFAKSLESRKLNLSKQLEIHKKELELNFEETKMRLLYEQTKMTVKFSKLHEERAHVIKKYYADLSTLEDVLTQFIKLFEGDKAKLDKDLILALLKEWKKIQERLNKLFRTNKILLSKNTCLYINNVSLVLLTLDKKLQQFLESVDIRIVEQINQELSIKKQLLIDINTLKLNLEDEFRLILGVENSE
ncbi:MAG: hypothetical protein GQ564_06945 [Bacteroidales bacterium]|nr:hypothetical protein [Bacteroidales bacterium]